MFSLDQRKEFKGISICGSHFGLHFFILRV